MPNEYQREYYRKNKERVLARIKQHYEAEFKSDPRRLLLRNAKHRATKRNIECDITLDDIIIPELCPVFEVPMEHGTFMAPSLDRVNNDKGYIKGNIQVMSKLANSMKNKATPEQLRKFAEWVLKN